MEKCVVSLISQVGEEVIVYDRERDTAHCLNAMAARVWHYCDGQNTVEDIAKLLEEDLEVSADEDVDWRGLVWLTLEELERFYLIQEYLSQPISSQVQSAGESRVSRRKMIKTATLVGGFAVGSMFPLVKSIVAPSPAMAAPPPTSSIPTPTPPPTPFPTSRLDSCKESLCLKNYKDRKPGETLVCCLFNQTCNIPAGFPVGECE